MAFGRRPASRVRRVRTVELPGSDTQQSAGDEAHPPRHREFGINALFRIHLAGVAGSNLADGVIAGALPLIAIALTRDPFLVSLVTAAFWLPWLIGARLVGVVVDRGAQARRRLGLPSAAGAAAPDPAASARPPAPRRPAAA